MREILFRGQDSRSKKWIYGYYNGRENSFARIIDTDYFTRFVNPETVGQYTGLCDKNGTKIFEGDILRLWGDGYDWNGIVVFGRTTSDEDNLEDYGYGWQLDKITKDEPVYTKILLWVEADGIDCEIIGNIHGNPELLNK